MVVWKKDKHDTGKTKCRCWRSRQTWVRGGKPNAVVGVVDEGGDVTEFQLGLFSSSSKAVTGQKSNFRCRRQGLDVDDDGADGEMMV